MPQPGKVLTRDISKPYWSTTDGETVRLYLGDVLEVLRKLPSRAVQCCVTSPPYWGLRDYRVDGQIGGEATPQEFVDKMVEVFREVRRVLRNDGTLWLNLGDTYNANTGKGNLIGVPWRAALALQQDGWTLRQDIIWSKTSPMPESVKNRCTKSHEYVFLLTKGMRYYYDNEAIKEKADTADLPPRILSPKQSSTPYRRMVSHNENHATSVLGRVPTRNKRSVWRISSEPYSGAHFATFPTKLIEPMILAGTSEYGACASCGFPWRRIVEETKLTRERPNDYVKYAEMSQSSRPQAKRAWEIFKSSGLTDEHLDAIRSCGVSDVGKALTTTDGAGQNTEDKIRLAAEAKEVLKGYYREFLSYKPSPRVNSCSNSVAGVDVRTVGWEPTCDCGTEEVRPCVVLDPFMGSGTTALVSLDLKRWSWGVDLSEKYVVQHQVRRIAREMQRWESTAHLVDAETRRRFVDVLKPKVNKIL